VGDVKRREAGLPCGGSGDVKCGSGGPNRLAKISNGRAAISNKKL
jgi:hypothetical protein